MKLILICLTLLSMLPVIDAATWEEQVRAVANTKSDETFPAGTWSMKAGDIPEKTFYRKGVPGPVDVNAVRVISLDLHDAVEFYLPTLPAGMYLVAFRCRTGGPTDVAEPEWFNCATGVKRGYSVTVDGTEIQMERGLAKPMLAFSGQGWGNWAGWVISRDFIPLRPGCRIRITANDSYQYVSDVALLTPTQSLACEWLVPDVLAKSQETPKRIRAKLVELEARTASLKTVPASTLTENFDAGFQDYCARLEKWKLAFEQAKTQKNQKALDMLAKKRTALLTEADQSLIWIEKGAEAWISRLLQAVDALPALPDTGDYHARWSAVLKNWIKLYYVNLTEKPAEEDSVTVARRLGRALRLADLMARYHREVELARPAAAAVPKTETAGKGNSTETASLCLNGLWDFSPGNDPEKPPVKWETIRVPHGPWQEYYGRNYNMDKKWNPEHHVGWYRTRFHIPSSWQGDHLTLRFDAVFYYAEVYVNGIYCGNHLGGFDRFFVNISKAVKPGMNEVQVMVKDSSDTAAMAQDEKTVVPPNYLYINIVAGAKQFGNYGGIWQDVYLEKHPDQVRIDDVAISTPIKGGISLNLHGRVKNTSDRERKMNCRFSVLDNTQTIAMLETATQDIAPGKVGTWEVSNPMPGVRLWGIGGEYGSPYLYCLKTELLENGRIIDIRYDRFGFSQLWMQGNQFVLNGKPLFLAGGGTWYLQEVKFPLGNRFYAQQLFRMDRGANINIERIHRQGDATASFYQEASEMGMLLEPECIGSAQPMLDAYGNADFADPVKLQTTADYYRSFAAKHRNYPCTALLSIENESFSHQYNEELMQLYLRMAAIVRQEDPLRIPDFHGNHLMAEHKGVPFINLHYYHADTLPRLRKTAAGRPIVNGEHNGSGYFLSNNRDRDTAAKGEQVYADFWRREITGYRQQAAGMFMFISSLGLYCSTSSWEKTTPWGDRFKDLSKCSRNGNNDLPCDFGTTVNISWPSLSGPDTKGESVAVATVFCTINWFDPARPVATPTKAYEALKESFPVMAACNIQRCQEALISVTDNNAPCAGATVMLTPLDGQPLNAAGAVTDPAGTAWIVPRLPGKYRVTAFLPDGREVESSLVLKYYTADRSGYESGLVRLSLDVRGRGAM